MPERVELVHIQHTRDSDNSAVCFIFRKRFSSEQQLLLEIIEIRNVVFVLLQAKTALTAVSGYELSTAGEPVDGQAAVVRASLALGIVSGIFQRIDLVDGEHGGLFRRCVLPAFPFMEAFTRDQTGSESAHDAGDIGTDCFAVCCFFKCTKNTVVIEGSALYNDMTAQLRRIRDLDDLVECIFNDRVRQSCRDILHGRAFLLCLFDLGIHEYRAACPEIEGMLGKQGCLGKVLHGIVQRLRESLDK